MPPRRSKLSSPRPTYEPLRSSRFFFKKAKREGHAARSVFKLQEIDRKHRLIRKGAKVLDLGAAPGSWMEYAARRTGSDGFVLGVDLSEIRAPLPSWTKTIRADIFGLDPAELIEEAGVEYDLVLSDAAPKTTGVPFADHARSVELSRRTLDIARAVLRPGGAWVCKVFQGEDLPPFRTEARKHFRRLAEAKPKSSRDRSVEIFLVGLGLIGEEESTDRG